MSFFKQINKLNNTIISHNTYTCNDFYCSYQLVECEKKDIISKHMHPCCEIVYLINGNLTYYHEDFYTSITTNDIIITPATKYHFYEAQANSKHSKIVFQFTNQSFFEKFYTNYNGQFKKINIANHKNLLTIFERLQYYISNINLPYIKENFDILINCLAIELMINLNSTTDNILDSTTTNPILSSILNYIEENLTSIPSLDVITKKFFISENYLHKLFKSNLKISPKQYVNSKKINLAHNLLNNGETLSQISEKCGFDNYSTFYRCYVKHFKHPPSTKK